MCFQLYTRVLLEVHTIAIYFLVDSLCDVYATIKFAYGKLAYTLYSDETKK